MLKIEDLESGYGPIQILWGVSLQVERGEVVTLLGANGAGKTTMIRTVSGELPVQRGQIEFLGQSIVAASAHRIVEAGLVQIPEGRQIWGGLSIEDNLDLGAYSKRARGHRRESKAWVYSLFPILLERRLTLARNLSGGQQQMLAIGRALMSRPTLLMLDEPSLGLAPQIVEELFEILVRINEQGISILLVEQNVDFALRLADRAYILEHGRMTRNGNAEELRSSDEVRAAYLGL
jgi:branched-chain amino acid transport system ATP-binding protein